nr:hypothetical protein [Tanacetum cinerariifolium]
MAEREIDNLTMDQYLAVTRGNQAPAANDDAHEHVERVLDIVGLFSIPGLSHDVVMLRVFPITLTGAAKRWIDRLPPGTVDSWDLLKKLLSKGFLDNEKHETDNSRMEEALAALW